MNKKIFLTSAVIMCMACPAIAESFPSDGNMVENETYANAAVYDNTGVYEGTATANAYYTTNNYNVSAGSYFTGLDNNNNATTATCTSGNYCPGVQSTTYDDVNSAFVDDGLQTCPSGYASSDLGASANTQCYRTCDIANMGENGTIAAIAHAASLSGNDYYGNGTDTCEPATCVAGWHVKPATPDVQNIVGDTYGKSYAKINKDGYFQEDSGSNFGREYFGWSSNDINKWAVYYGSDKGVLIGEGRCSSVSGTTGTFNGASTGTERTTHTTAELGVEGGNYCYCNLTGYRLGDGPLHSLSTPWAYIFDSTRCASSCASSCAENAKSSGLTFRTTLLGFVNASSAICEANTITINWANASADAISANNAGNAIYGGDIRTPAWAQTKPGQVFRGWRFSKPVSNNNNNQQ